MAALLSGKSSDGLIDHGHSVGAVLEIDTAPLVVHIVIVIDLAMDDGRHHVDEEEDGDRREDQTDKIAREADVDLSIPLKSAEGVPQAAVVRRGSEGGLLLAKAWDVKVNACAKLSLDFKALDHGHDLALFLVGHRVVGAELAEVLREIVLHILCQNFY